MKFIAVLVVSFFSICTIAQPLQVSWIKTIPGSLYEQGNSVMQAPCGDLYVVGFFQEHFGNLTAVGGEDGYIAKYSEQGQLLWLKQLNGIGADRLNAVTIADDNQIYIAGEFKNTFYYNNDSLVSLHQLDMMLLKIDSSGNILWAKSGGGTGYQAANDIELSPNGNLCVTGYFENNLVIETDTAFGQGLRDVFVATFDQMGNLQWLKSMGGPAFDDGRSIHADAADNIYVTGSFRDYLIHPAGVLMGFGGYDVYLAKFNASGVFQWIKKMEGPALDEASYVNVDSKQNVYVGGWYDGSLTIDNSTVINGAKEEDGFVAKFDSNGTLLWSEALAGRFDERVYAIDFDGDDNVYVMGMLDSIVIIGGDTLTNRHLNRPMEIFIVKFDETGTYQWGQDFGHYYNDFGYDIWVDNGGTIYLAGSFQDTSIFMTDTLLSQFGYDVFLAKLEIDTSVGVQQIPFSAYNDLSNILFYPNPSNKTSTLSYELKERADLKITLYDALGRTCRVILEEEQAAGQHQIPIEKKEENGLYFLTVATQNSTWTVKLIWTD